MKKRYNQFLTFLAGGIFIFALSFQANSQITNAILITSSSSSITSNHYQDALNSLGVTTTAFTSTALGVNDFLNAVDVANPATDIVIMDVWNGAMDLDQGNILPDFINNGGKAIISAWQIASYPNTMAALGIQNINNNGSATFNMYDWGGSTFFNGILGIVPFNASAFGTTNTRFMMTPAAGATVGGFAVAPGTPNEGAIIIANGGNTVAFGACMNTVVNPGDGMAMALNIVTELTAGAAPVPTLGQWGLIILSLLMMSIVMAFSTAPKMVTTNGMEVSQFSLKNLPFERNAYLKTWAATAVGILAIFTVAIQGFGYELTSADPIGALVSSFLVAYAFFVLKNEN